MRIGTASRYEAGGRAGVLAPVRTAERQFELYYEVDDRFSEWLAIRPEPFLIVAATFASWLGEDRVETESGCPEVVAGVETLLRVLRTWYPQQFQRLPEITCTRLDSVQESGGIAASFVSGGLDSLAILRANMRAHPLDHPNRVRAGIFVNWAAGSADPAVRERARFLEHRGKTLQAFGNDIGIPVACVGTNLLSLVGYSRGLWTSAWHGPCLASVGHALSGGLRSVRIASGSRLEELKPWGSHPFLEPWLSSEALRVIHEGITMSRTQKSALVAGWPEAVNALNVCTGPLRSRLEPGACGPCEKCLRTAAEFLASGHPEAAEAVLGRAMATDEVRSLRLAGEGSAVFWAEIAREARTAGLRSLAEAADGAVRRYRRRALLRAAAARLGALRFLRTRLQAWRGAHRASGRDEARDRR